MLFPNYKAYDTRSPEVRGLGSCRIMCTSEEEAIAMFRRTHKSAVTVYAEEVEPTEDSEEA